MQDRDDQGNGEGMDGTPTPQAAARYIAAITGELAKIARRNGLDPLAYLLEMARLEAEQFNAE